MKRVAIIGTQGVPACYGGFESLVENIIECGNNIQYTVFCSSKDMTTKIISYKGAQLKYIPLRANGIQSIPYDILSLCRSVRGYDTILILGVSGCIFLPIFRLFSRAKVVTNIDGLEHRRAKWGALARWFLRLSEKLAVKFSDIIVADNKGIADYVKEQYGIDAEMIAYGGDHVIRTVDKVRESDILKQYDVEKFGYSFSLCRIEPENNCHIILEAAAKSGCRLIFVGNWDRCEYSRNLKVQYSQYPNITIANPVYNLDTLFVLRSCASRYIHGHSAGGTNPSLVEAMFFGREILAYDVVYNRETTLNNALYFNDVQSLVDLLNQKQEANNSLLKIAEQLYTWDSIRLKYEALF